MSDANPAESLDREPGRCRMTVDQTICIGSGQCELLEAETFYVDDDTAVAGVLGTAMLPPDRAAKVVDTCPTGAVSIVDADA